MAVANTLAYYVTATITAVKSFIVQVQQLFSYIVYLIFTLFFLKIFSVPFDYCERPPSISHGFMSTPPESVYRCQCYIKRFELRQ
jgi:hypothetical protein